MPLCSNIFMLLMNLHIVVTQYSLFPYSYPRAMDMLKAGKIDLAPLVAARFPLHQTNDALKATAGGLTTGFKVIVDCTQ